jgi:hypothetical protein
MPPTFLPIPCASMLVSTLIRFFDRSILIRWSLAPLTTRRATDFRSAECLRVWIAGPTRLTLSPGRERISLEEGRMEDGHLR